MSPAFGSMVRKKSSLWSTAREFGALTAALSLLATGLPASSRSIEIAEEARAVWFSRFEYSSEEDIRAEIAKADSCRCNMILFQVRGQGDAFYISNHEPWSQLLGGNYPGFDPLAVAIEEATLRHIELHGYVNAFPVWSGVNPPDDPQHIYNAYPQWVMVDQTGTPMNPANGYAFLSPGIPQAAQHVRDVIIDIVDSYDVDGIHLDYIRYPSSGYSYDDSSLARFQSEYGGTPAELPDQWKQFRRNLVTQFVSDVHQDVTSRKPWVKISAATWGDFYSGYTFYYQDSHGWLELGTLDFHAPMIYVEDMAAFRSRLANHVGNTYGRHVYAGIGAYLLEAAELLAQVDTTRSLGAQGCTIFSASSLGSGEVNALRTGPFSQPADVPGMPWKEPKPFTLAVARSISGTQVDLLFNREVQKATAEEESHYSFDHGLSLAAGESARVDSVNAALVHLTTTSQIEGTIYTLNVTGVQDLAGQPVTHPNASRKFVGQAHSGLEMVIDNADPAFSTMGTWTSGSYGNPYGSDYRWASPGSGSAAIWTPQFTNAGTYDVYAYWVQGSNRATNAPYIIHHLGGADTVRVNQRQNGERWNKLGSYAFAAGAGGDVTLTNDVLDGVVIADAVKLVEVFTSVALAHLAAREQNGAVMVTWAVDPHLGAMGYHVYRGISSQGPFQRLNGQLLPGGSEGTYLDREVQGGQRYFYLLGVVDASGQEELHGPVAITFTGSTHPDAFALNQNYPNPFNTNTHIGFTIPSGNGPLATSLRIFNILGQGVRTLADMTMAPGRYTLIWDGRDESGQTVASGVYFCRLSAGEHHQVRKMVLLR